MRLSSEVLKGNSLLNQVTTQSCVQFGVFPHEPEYLSGLEWLREPISNMEAIFAVMNTTEENIPISKWPCGVISITLTTMKCQSILRYSFQTREEI